MVERGRYRFERSFSRSKKIHRSVQYAHVHRPEIPRKSIVATENRCTTLRRRDVCGERACGGYKSKQSFVSSVPLSSSGESNTILSSDRVGVKKFVPVSERNTRLRTFRNALLCVCRNMFWGFIFTDRRYDFYDGPRAHSVLRTWTEVVFCFFFFFFKRTRVGKVHRTSARSVLRTKTTMRLNSCKFMCVRAEYCKHIRMV
jgi:hypothetical protein